MNTVHVILVWRRFRREWGGWKGRKVLIITKAAHAQIPLGLIDIIVKIALMSTLKTPVKKKLAKFCTC